MKTETGPAASLSGWKIPVHQYGLFRVILKSCGGDLDYVRTSQGEVHVGFHFNANGDYAAWSRQWDLATTNIVERRKDAKWMCAARRLGLGWIVRRVAR